MLSAATDKVSVTFILKMLLRTIVLILAVISITLAFRLKSSPNQKPENGSNGSSDLSVDNTSECTVKVADLSRIYGFRDHLILAKIDPSCHSLYYRSKQSVLRQFHKMFFGDLSQFKVKF